ncbi:MAG: hypothetical protein GX542_13100 [Rhodococcus sp.]|nr:hypothetical protein [Rhodococcus sp. (in: high G+C Gram-positive bacteria)]
MDRGTGELIHRRNALVQGYTDDEMRRARKRGQLTSVCAGVYVETSAYDALDAVGQHRLRALAAASKTFNGAALSHVSAVIMHGFDTWNLPLRHIHFVVNRNYGGGTHRHKIVHPAAFDTHETVVIDNQLVTSAARTIVDLSRTAGFEEAVVVGDHALRIGAVTPEELQATLDSNSRRCGNPKARRAVSFMSGLSGSAGESRSRVSIHLGRLPAPTLQKAIYDVHGRLIGYVDFFWEEYGVVGEFDGLAKYGMTAGRTPKEMLREEKRREDALREVGLVVVRWMWEDLGDPERLRRKIEYAFEKAKSYRGARPPRRH